MTKATKSPKPPEVAFAPERPKTNTELLAQTYEASDHDVKNLGSEVEVLEAGEWVQDVKVQRRTTIVFFMGGFYSIRETRSGSAQTYFFCEDTVIGPVMRQSTLKEVIAWPALNLPTVTIDRPN